jgi:hypothetical protein
MNDTLKILIVLWLVGAVMVGIWNHNSPRIGDHQPPEPKPEPEPQPNEDEHAHAE